ncbi:hypothetical protein [Iodobacter sp.]|uniref:hypothetical protein n=1 Tax=Iodobacter sp. TaxID=1915058 RepID=UPI0025D945B3|nr:hypothetical protein [Iodobacter sp.]
MNNLPEKKVYICLPGQDAKGIVAGCANRVILRKHRDVVFDINLKKGNAYTLRAEKSDFYNERDKTLVEVNKKQKVSFKDGERFTIWVSREFKGSLVLELNGAVIGKYAPNKLDGTKYGDDPKVKPEPMLVVMGSKDASLVKMQCTADDPYGMGQINKQEVDFFTKYLADKSMKQSQFDYASFQPQKTQVQEHVIVGELTAKELHPAILAKLDAGGRVSGTPEQILVKEPMVGSDFYQVFNNVVNSNLFKEPAGYVQSNWRVFNMLLMKMYIEKSLKGTYRYVLKGRLITPAGITNASKTIKMPVGHPNAEFLGGNYSVRGRGGMGGFKRVFLTTASNAVSGLKIAAIGTVIDLYGDATTVFGDEKSNDISEFLGRAGVSLIKAATTTLLASVAIIGFNTVLASFFSVSLGVVGGAVVGTTAIPVFLAIAIVIGGYVVSAYIVDWVDDRLKAKEYIASKVK